MKVHKVMVVPNEADVSYVVAVDIYPNQDFYNTYHTDAPWTMCFWSVMMVLFASVVFFVYDHFVQVESNAKEHIMDTRRRLVRFASHEIRTPLNTVMLGLELLHHMILNTAGDVDSYQHPEEGECDEFKTDVAQHIDMSKTALEARNREIERQEDLVVLADIESSTAAAVVVLNDLLDYDAIEMDIMEIHIQPINSLEFMDSAIRQFNIQAKQKNIKMRSNLKLNSCPVPPGSHAITELLVGNERIPLESFCFLGDRHRLMQVFRNLISNALKFTPKGGDVTITASWEAIEASDAKKITDQRASVLFSIRDTGPGISKRNQRLLFGEGVQFDANRLQEGRGSGLGLFISKKIVAAHHGRVWAKSDGEGMGSCFFLELPLQKLAEVKPNDSSVSSSHSTSIKSLMMYKQLSGENGPSPSVARQGSKGSVGSSRTSMDLIVFIKTKRILVVDDVASNRKLACKMLEVNGFTADHATNGKDCLAKMQALEDFNVYDCILMDFMMPDMNGPEVTIVLREMGYVNPVIGLTANLMLDDINHFMNSGASLVMPKPFNFKDFKRMLIMPGVDI
jgi:signal transduction histidine kinase